MQEFHPVSILLMEAKAHIMKLALEGKRKIFCRTKRYDLLITLKKLTLERKAGQTAFLLEGGVWTPDGGRPYLPVFLEPLSSPIS